MLRKCTDEDISDEECEKVIDLFYENYDSYLEEYVMVISNDNLIRAISEYKNNFNKKEYMDWALDNGWTIGHIHRMFRTYLQRHVAYRNSSM